MSVFRPGVSTKLRFRPSEACRPAAETGRRWRPGRGWRVLRVAFALLVVSVAASTLCTAGAQAKVGPTIEHSRLLTRLAEEARALLNAHLPPSSKFELPIDIGYAISPHEGEVSPAETFPARDSSFCEIAVDQATWNQSRFTGGYDGTGQGDKDRALEIITHEAFHCYQIQLLGNAYNGVHDWVKEGLPRWVDLSLFPANPVPSAAGNLEQYFKSPTQSLFARAMGYDAVGFWAHLADMTDLWQKIPDIIRASKDGNQATIAAALNHVDQDRFFDTWGSSAANPPNGDASWTAKSPFPPRDPYESAARSVNTAGDPNTTVSIKLDPYSTFQLRIDLPAAPAGEVETIRIELDGAYGRFGPETNYTGSELTSKTFCASTTSCQTITPTSSSCPAAAATPTLTPMPADALLGLAAAATEATAHIVYATIPTATSCDCKGSSTRAHVVSKGSGTPADDVSCTLPARSCSSLVSPSTFPSEGGQAAAYSGYGELSTNTVAYNSTDSECDIGPTDLDDPTAPSTLAFVELLSFNTTAEATTYYGNGELSFLLSDPADPYILSTPTPIAVGDAADVYMVQDQAQTTTGVGGAVRVDNDVFVFDCLEYNGGDCPDAAGLLTDVAGGLG